MKFSTKNKNEQTPSKSKFETNVTNTKLINSFKTIYFTPDTPVNNKMSVINNNNNSITSRHVKSSQPKRLKRNRLLINTKFNVSKNETPVRAYLNAKRQQNYDDDDYDVSSRVFI
jgi:hypothetical protein